jgi:hypothetical protein
MMSAAPIISQIQAKRSVDRLLLEGMVDISFIPFRMIEITISARQATVVSRKWYREGYFIE